MSGAAIFWRGIMCLAQSFEPARRVQVILTIENRERLRGIALSALCSVLPSIAFAQSANVSWTAPRGCPTEAEVRAQVDRLFRARAVEPEALDARAVVHARAGQFVLALTIRQGAQGLELIVRCTLDGVGARADVEAFLARAKRSVLRVRVESACGRAHD